MDYSKNLSKDVILENCAVNILESDLNQEIKLAILKKASQIKIENRKKRKEDKGEVKIRKNSKDIKN